MCEVKEGQLVSVTECHEIQPVEGGIEVHRNGTPEVVDGSQLVSMNTWGFTPAVFQEARQGFSDFLRANSDPVKGEYYIPTLVQQIMDAGKGTVEVLPADDAWLGVTYPEDKARVQAGLQALADQGVYPRPLWGEG
jgi:hypothetical protein